MSTKSVWDWNQANVPDEDKTSFFDRIGKDVQIVRSVLLLTGALHGSQKQVNDYLESFKMYDWLWKDDMEYMYNRFVERNPTIEAFGRELAKFVAIEEEIGQITA